MICKITALCWVDSNTDNCPPDMYCFYIKVEPSMKDNARIGNFLLEKSNINNEPTYIYLILNRHFLSNSEDLEADIDIINYENLSVLYKHNEQIQYRESFSLLENESYYLIEYENGKSQKYYYIDELLQAIKFKDATGNQISYIAGEHKIEECCWKYIKENYFEKEKQNNFLNKHQKKKKNQ